MKLSFLARVTVLFAVFGSLTNCRIASAQTQHVTITTGALNGQGTHYIEFTLTSGGSTLGNSTATISHFLLTGGTLGGVLPPTTGNVTGDLGNTLTLTDSDAPTGLADFAQAFSLSSASSTLTFDLTPSHTSIDTPIPDYFAVQILDSTQTPLATDGPTGVEFVSVSYTSINSAAQGYSSTNSIYSPPITTVVTTESAVPEPGTWVCFFVGLLGIYALIARGCLTGQRHFD